MTQKCFISSLSTNITVENETIYFNKRKIDFVWIQGIISAFEKESDEITIDDGTGCIIVLLPNDINKSMIGVGQYVMIHGILVIGEDESTGEELIFVSGRTVSVLNDPNSETLWTLEILST